MTGDDLISGGSEIQKTSKTLTEYRKTESEAHEVERDRDYEQCVTSSEMQETSVTRHSSNAQ